MALMARTFACLFPACIFIMQYEIDSEHFYKKYKTLQNLTPAYSLRLIFQCYSPCLEYLFSGTPTDVTSFTWNAASFMKIPCFLTAHLDASAHMLSVICQHLSIITITLELYSCLFTHLSSHYYSGRQTNIYILKL